MGGRPALELRVCGIKGCGVVGELCAHTPELAVWVSVE